MPRAVCARIWPGVLLALLVLVVFRPVVGFPFLGYEDNRYVTGNPVVRQGLSGAGLRWAFTTTYDGNWFPLTWLSHLLDAQAFGVRPGGPHLISLLGHLVNALLLAGLLKALTGRRLASFFCAAVFAVHPLQVESVAWISQRRSILMLLFGLLALRAYAGYVRRPSGGRYAALLGFFLCGLMSKALLVMLPLGMLLLDFWPLGRIRPAPYGGRASRNLRPILEKAPLLGLAALIGAVTVRVQDGSGAMPLEGLLRTWDKIVHAVTAYGWYLGKAFWPSGLAVFYPYPMMGVSRARIVLAVAALLGISSLAILLRRRAPSLAVGWLWFLVMLLPVIGLLQVGEQAWADRYMYGALIGPVVATAWTTINLAARRDRAPWLPAAAIGILCALALAGAAQVSYWRDDESLFRRAAAVTEGNFVAHNSLGLILMEKGRFAEAAESYAEAIRLQPGAAGAGVHNNRGLALYRLGRYAEAIAEFREALRCDPREYQSRHNMGLAYARLGRHEEAIAAFREVLRWRPRQVSTLNALGESLLRCGRTEEAAGTLAAASELDPQDPFVRANRALAEAELHRERNR